MCAPGLWEHQGPASNTALGAGEALRSNIMGKSPSRKCCRLESQATKKSRLGGKAKAGKAFSEWQSSLVRAGRAINVQCDCGGQCGSLVTIFCV